MSEQLMYHCGFSMGSMTSFERLEKDNANMYHTDYFWNPVFDVCICHGSATHGGGLMAV